MSPLVIVAILILGFLLSRTQLYAKFRKQVLLGAAAILILWLVVTGKLHALFALVAAALPMMQRIVGVLTMIPGVRNFISQATQNQQTQQPAAKTGPMTREQAAEILGVSPDASPAEIRAAHRKLMGKLHPDKGGNDFLASQLNNARDKLLS
ncbi:MAG: J domain-containing protein [Litorivicinus sp.]